MITGEIKYVSKLTNFAIYLKNTILEVQNLQGQYSEFSLSFRFNVSILPSSSNNVAKLIDFGNFNIQITLANKLEAKYTTVSGTQTFEILDVVADTDYFVCATFQHDNTDTEFRMYVDYLLKVDFREAENNEIDLNNSRIGEGFEGFIDDIIFFDSTINRDIISKLNEDNDQQDIWINQKSFAKNIISVYVEKSNSILADTFEIVLGIKSLSFDSSYIAQSTIVTVIIKGVPIFNGIILRSLVNENNTVTMKGNDVIYHLQTAYIRFKEFQNVTRSTILKSLIDEFIPHIFSSDAIEEITTDVLAEYVIRDRTIISIFKYFRDFERAVLSYQPNFIAPFELQYRSRFENRFLGTYYKRLDSPNQIPNQTLKLKFLDNSLSINEEILYNAVNVLVSEDSALNNIHVVNDELLEKSGNLLLLKEIDGSSVETSEELEALADSFFESQSKSDDEQMFFVRFNANIKIGDTFRFIDSNYSYDELLQITKINYTGGSHQWKYKQTLMCEISLK